MADKIKAIKIKQRDGTYTQQVPISVSVQNVQWDENNHTLLDALGSVDISSFGKGNLQHQIDELDGDKISTNEFNSRLNDFLKDQISADTTDWLDDNVNPVGSAVIVDKTLTIDGAAADALAVKTELNKKANASNTYTKAEVNAAIDAKQIEVDDTLSITGTAADAKAVGDELTAVKADLEGEVGVFKWIKGKYINLNTYTVSLTPIVNEIMTYTVVDCSEGDSFIINAAGATGVRAWGFVDANNGVISKADPNVTVTNLTLTAPANAVKLIINNKGDGENHGLCYRLGSNLISRVTALEAAESELSEDVKAAILTCFRHLVWENDDGPDYIEELRKVLYGWDKDTLYILMNTPVSLDGATTLDTEFTLWKTDYSFTLFAEYIDNVNHSVDTENKMLFRQGRENPFGAFYMQTYNGGQIDDSTYKAITVFDIASGAGDKIKRVWHTIESKTVISNAPRRVILSYNADTKAVTIDFSVDGQIISPISTTGDLSNLHFYEMDDTKSMLIGSLSDSGRFFKGVINDFRIVKKAATSTEISEYLTRGNSV